MPYSDSHAPMPQPGQPWDWFHINAVHLDTDGNLLISSRFTWTIYKVNLRTGATIWQLGGKHSTFAVKAAPGQKLDSAGEIFAFQHDPEALGSNVYTVFDDESDGQSTLYSSSRAVTISLDLATGTATLIESVNQPEGLTAGATGSAQTTKTATCSSAGAGCPTSPSSARQESCYSTPSSPTAWTPTAPTGCRGIRAASVPSALLQIDLASQPARLIPPKLTPHLHPYRGSVAPDQSICAPPADRTEGTVPVQGGGYWRGHTKSRVTLRDE